jgi:hypothetical protein
MNTTTKQQIKETTLLSDFGNGCRPFTFKKASNFDLVFSKRTILKEGYLLKASCETHLIQSDLEF